MQIVTKNGIDYLESYVLKINNRKIDANKLFIDIEEAIQFIKKKHKITHKKLDKKFYGGNLQLFLNRFSGQVVSPSFFKSYTTNPALCLMSNFFSDSDDYYIQLGNLFHKFMENYYSLKKEDRNKENCIRLLKELNIAEEYKQAMLVMVKNYFNTESYSNKELTNVEVEQYGSDFLYVESLDYTTPIKFSYVLDRVDFREDGIYLLDYKTSKNIGKGDTFDGYLASMLFYKWACEKKYNTELKGGYLVYPQVKDNMYVPLDFSKEKEIELVKKIDKFNTNFKKDARLKVFEFTDEGYFNSKDSKAFKDVMVDSLKYNYKIPVRLKIGEHRE